MVEEHCAADIETYSEAPLRKCGAYKYAEHPSTEILCLMYGFVTPLENEPPVHAWIPYDDIPEEVIAGAIARVDEDGNPVINGEVHVGSEMPQDLRDWMEAGKQMRAHNAEFEFVNMNGPPGQKLGIPKTENSQWVCTAAKVSALSLPRALGYCAEACDTHRKDENGKMDMMQVTKPRRGKEKRYTPQNSPDRFIKLYSYCADDVKAEMGLDDYAPDLSPNEQNVWEMCRGINDHGIKVDLKAIGHAKVLIDKYKRALEKNFYKRTLHLVPIDPDDDLSEMKEVGLTPGQTAKIAEWVRDNGYKMENLQAATVKVALADPNCPDKVKHVLRIRTYHAMKATTKYNAMEVAVCDDGRLHGMFMFHGAGTGRWAGRIVQLQNLFRPIIKDPDIAIEAFSAEDLQWIAALYDQNPMKVFASCIRGMLIPEDGKDLVVFDSGQIEARVTPWLSGQLDVLEIFRSGKDIYKFAAAQIYGVEIEDVTSDQRFIGKIAILALGYQGGKKAFAKMAKNYGVDIEEEFAEEIKNDWRKANPKTVRFWYGIEEAAQAAVANPGQVFQCGKRKIMFKVEGEFLYMRLPSGRRLAYYQPQLDAEGKVTYMGIDTYTRQWKRVSTYGGKLTENAVQAIARDMLVFWMFALEKAGFDIIGHVHDEVILEILESMEGGGNGKDVPYWGVMKVVYDIFCSRPPWAEGLPLDAGGYRAKRYRK